MTINLDPVWVALAAFLIANVATLMALLRLINGLWVRSTLWSLVACGSGWLALTLLRAGEVGL